MTLLFALDPVSQSEKGANRVKRERERGSCFKPSNKDRERGMAANFIEQRLFCLDDLQHLHGAPRANHHQPEPDPFLVCAAK